MVSATLEQPKTIVLTLSEQEARQLANEINAKADSLRHALLRFYDGKGWVALGYDSFKAWAIAECTVSFQHAYKLMNVARVENDLSIIEGTDLFVPVNVGKQLARLETAALRQKAYEKAKTHASTAMRDITERDAIEAVKIVQKEEFIKNSNHHVLIQMVNKGSITVDGGERITKWFERCSPETILYVQQKMAAGLKDLQVIHKIVNRHRQYIKTGEVSLNLSEIDRTGRIAGVPLDRADISHWKAMAEQNAEEHKEKARQKKLEQLMAEAEANGEEFKPVEPKAMNAYTNDPERTLHELKAVLSDETLDGLFRLMAKERGMNCE